MWDKTDDETITDELEELDIVLDDFPIKRTRKKKDKNAVSEDYVNKDDMWNELYNYYQSLGSNYNWVEQKINNKAVFPPISSKLTNTITDIATKMGYRGNFCRYSWLDEMIGDSILKMVKAVRDCSFKCFTIVSVVRKDDENSTVHYIDKKGQEQSKLFEESDEYFTSDEVLYLKFKANPFGYFSRITSHSYLNRIKKENTLEETKRAFQSETWERLYADENFKNVRRHKIIESDENDSVFEE
jgi:site-specific DNA-adenine methylase